MPIYMQKELIEKFSEGSQEYAGTLSETALVLAQANQRLCSMQLEAAQAALGENLQHLISLLKHPAEAPVIIEQCSTLYQRKAERFVVTGAAWAEISAQAITALNQLLTAQFPQTNALGDQENDEAKTVTFADRRVSAQMFVFPERRNRIISEQILVKPLQYGETRQTTKKKNAA